MEDMTDLQAKLHRVQAVIAESVGRLTKQRVFIANRLAAGEDVSQFLELLATLEDTQLIHVQHPRPTEEKAGWSGRGEELGGLTG